MDFVTEMSDQSYNKRKRNSTGGTGVGMDTYNGLTYADIARNIQVGQMSDSEKLNFLIAKMCSLESLTTQLQNTTAKLNEAYKTIEQMNIQVTVLDDRACTAEYKLIDLEARSRRCNLIFNNIAESDTNELEDKSEEQLIEFLTKNMAMGGKAKEIVFQRVHRLGRRKSGLAPNGDPWKPRPIIAEFRDFKVKEQLLRSSRILKGSQFSVQQDFPAEIRTARGKLWGDYCVARANNQRASIAYPAKLIIENNVVRDEFPDWQQRLFGRQGANPAHVGQQRTGNPYMPQPRQGVPPPNHSLADYIGAQPFRPAGPRPQSILTNPVTNGASNLVPQFPPPGYAECQSQSTQIQPLAQLQHPPAPVGVVTHGPLPNAVEEPNPIPSQDTQIPGSHTQNLAPLSDTIAAAMQTTINAE